MAKASTANEVRARHVDRLLAQAAEAGPGSAAYVRAVSEPDCRRAILGEAERCIDWALDETDAYRDLFIFRLAAHVDAWPDVFDDDRMKWIADELRGATVLKGLTKTFGAEPWWPR